MPLGRSTLTHGRTPGLEQNFRSHIIYSSEGSFSYGVYFTWAHAQSFCYGQTQFAITTSCVPEPHLPPNSDLQYCQGPAVMGVQTKPQTIANLQDHENNVRERKDILGTWGKPDISDLFGLHISSGSYSGSPCVAHHTHSLSTACLLHTTAQLIPLVSTCHPHSHPPASSRKTQKISQLTFSYTARVKYALKDIKD